MAEKITFDIIGDISALSSTVGLLADALQSKAGDENVKDMIAGLRELQSEATTVSAVFEKIPISLQSTVGKMVDSLKEGFGAILKDGTLTKSGEELGQQVGLQAASFKTLMTGLKEIYGFTQNASEDQLKAFNKNYQGLANSVQEVAKGFLGRNGTGPASVESIYRTFIGQTERAAGFAALLESMNIYGDVKRGKTQQAIIKSLANLVTPLLFQDDYLAAAERYSGGTLNRSTIISRGLYGTYKERLPESLRDLPYLITDLKTPDKEPYNKALTEKQYKQITDLARRNEALRKALVLAGYASYQNDEETGASSLMMAQRTKMKIGDVSNLVARLFYNVYKPAAESNAVNYAPLNTTNAKQITRIANRASKESVQALGALSVLQDVTGGLAPTTAYASTIAPENHTNYLGGIGSPQQESYIVMSLTPEDFKNNKYPEQRVVTYGRRAVDTLQGQSMYISLNRSRMTEWAGMHGNRTFGNGIIGDFLDADNPDIRKNLPMIIIDYSADWMIKDEDGNLVQNPEVTKQVEELFRKNKQFKYTYQGKEHTYAYPSTTRNENGEQKTYVPIAMKGGGAYLITEDAYVAQSKQYLEQYGVNAIDNFISPDKGYNKFSALNKDFEARNRNLTPSVPFSEIGAAIDGKKTKFAVVDLEKYFGIDGAMFAMPGITPGGDATIRAPFMNMKGVMQSLDWKTIIRDIYGLKEDDPFYIPGVNLPEELGKLYETGGLDAVKNNAKYGGENYQKTLDTYFEDIMKADVLVSSSLVKTDLLDGLSGRAATEFFINRYNSVKDSRDLFRLVKTAEQLQTMGQMRLSLQMAEKIAYTPDEIVNNAKAWRQHIDKLRNDADYQKEHIFTGDADEDKRFRQDPVKAIGIASVQTRISEAIATAENMMMSGLPFEANNLQMRLALVHPGSFITGAGDRSGYKIKNAQLYNNFKPNDNEEKGEYEVIAPGILKAIAGGRYPTGFNEIFALKNNGLLAQMALDGKYGLNKDALYLSPMAIQMMGGGDFDGDTVQLLLDELAQTAMRSGQEMKDRLEAKGVDTSIDKENKDTPIEPGTKMNESFIAQLGFRQLQQSVKLGAVSNAMQNLSQLDWTDDDTIKEYGPAMAQTRMMYDIDSTFQKTGIEAEWLEEAKNASFLGRPIISAYDDVFKVLGGNIPKSKLPNLAKYNFASIFSAPSALMLAAASKNGLSNETMNALLNMERDINGINLAALNTDTAEGAYKTYLDASLQAKIRQMGTGAIVDDGTFGELNAMLALAQQRLNEEKNSAANGDSNKNLDELQKNINKQKAELRFLKLTGLTSENVRAGKGYHTLFKNNQEMADQPVFGEMMQGVLDEKRIEEEIRMFNLKAALATDYTTQTLIRAGVLGGIEEEDFAKKQADAVEKVKNMRYSYSNLSLFKKDPVEWVKRYINKEKEEPASFSQIGSAFHAGAQYWALSRIKEQYEAGNANNNMTKNEKARWKKDKMFYEAALNDRRSKVLLENASADDAFLNKLGEEIITTNADGTTSKKRLFEVENGQIKSNASIKEKSRIEAARAFLKKLDVLYSKDEYDVLGTEVQFTQEQLRDLLPQRDPKSSTEPISFTGFSDLVLRNKKTGKLEVVDWKPTVTGDYEKDAMQLKIYAESMEKIFGTKVDVAKYLGYVDGNEQTVLSNGLSDKDKIGMKEELQSLFTSMSAIAEATGFYEPFIDKLKKEAPDWTQFKSAKEVTEIISEVTPADLARAGHGSQNSNAIMRIMALKRGMSIEGMDDYSSEQIAAILERDILSEEKLNEAGFTVAAGMAMREDSRALTEKFQEISDEAYVAAAKTNRDEKYNPWESRGRKIDRMKTDIDLFRKKSLEGHKSKAAQKLVNDQAELLERKRQGVLGDFNNSLSMASINDLKNAAEDFEKALNKPAKANALSGYAEAFDAITNKIKTSRQAYDEWLARVGKGEIKTTDDEKTARAKELEKMTTSAEKLRGKTKEEMLDAFNLDLERKRNYAIGGRLSAETERMLAEKDYRKSFIDMGRTIKQFEQEGLLSFVEAKRMRKDLVRSFDLKGYMKYYDEMQKENKEYMLANLDADLERKRNYATGGELSSETRRKLAQMDYERFFEEKKRQIEQSAMTEDEKQAKIKEIDASKDVEGYMAYYDKMQKEMKEERLATFNQRSDALVDEVKYGHVSKSTSVDKAVHDFETRQKKLKEELDAQYKTDAERQSDEYKKKEKKLDSVTVEDYKNRLYDQEFKKNQAELRSYNRMLSTHGFNFGRVSTYSRMKDQLFDRETSLNKGLEQSKKQMEFWQKRADEIKAQYTTKDANGQAVVDESALKADKGYQDATAQVINYGKAVKDTKSELNGFANKHKGMAAVINTFTSSLQNMANMYARQFVRKMISAATQFVKTYDSTMTEIQMVTLKTDSEIASLGETMLQTAEDLKVSFSDVAKVTVELYRQGLDDESIADRSEQILKFSKVTGISASDAIKMMTVAMSSGLVEDSEHVVDAVTVLGDAAATNAQQITKGLQKSLPAAETANVTFEELNAMLTAITANTQLSGSVAGTTMRNVMSRMTRVKSGDLVYDEKGNPMSASSLATSLKAAGIEVVEGVTDQFREIAKHWDDLTDMQKNQIAYELGGTQQYSNVVSVIDAFAEKDEVTGESQIDKYLRLQEESDGAVDEKYDIYEESLAAKTTELSNAFNNLVAAVFGITNEGNAAESVLGNFVDMLVFCVEGLEKLAPIITGLLAALAIAAVVFTTAGKIAAAVAVIGALAQGVSLLLPGAQTESQAQQRYEASKKELQQSMDVKAANDEARNSLIKEYEEILNRVKENGATQEDLIAYNSVVGKLNNMGFACVSAADSVDELNAAAQGAQESLTGLKNAAEQKSNEEAVEIILDARNLLVDSEGVVAEINEKTGEKAAMHYNVAKRLTDKNNFDSTTGQAENTISYSDFFSDNFEYNDAIREALVQTLKNGAAQNMELSNGRYLTESYLKSLNDSDLLGILQDNDNVFTDVLNTFLKETYGAYFAYVKRAKEYTLLYGYDMEKIFDDYYESGEWKRVIDFWRGSLETQTKNMSEEDRKKYVRNYIGDDTLIEYVNKQEDPSQYYDTNNITGKKANNLELGDNAFWKTLSTSLKIGSIQHLTGLDGSTNLADYDRTLAEMDKFILPDQKIEEAEETTAADYNRDDLIIAATAILSGQTLSDGTPVNDYYTEKLVDAEIEKMKNNENYHFWDDFVTKGPDGTITDPGISEAIETIEENRETWDKENVPTEPEETTPVNMLSVAAAAASSGESFKKPLQKLYNEVLARKDTDHGAEGLISWLNELSGEDKTTMQTMLQNEDYQDVATALANFANIDEDGNITFREDLSPEDWQNLMNAIAGHSTSLGLFATQTNTNKRKLALDMLNGLAGAENKIEYWESPTDVKDEVAENMRTALTEIIGEEDALSYINGTMNERGKQYVNNAVARYGTDIDAYTSEEIPGVMSSILGDLDGKTPEEQLAYIESLGDGLNSVLENSFDEWKSYKEGLAATANGIEGYDLDSLLGDLKDSVSESEIKNLYKYDDAVEEIVSTFVNLKKGGKDAASAVSSLTSNIRTLSNARWALEKYKNGDRSDNVLSALSNSFGYNAEDLKNAEGLELQSYLTNMDLSLDDQTTDLELQAQSALDTLMADVLAENPEYDFTANINADGSYDLTGLLTSLDGLQGDAAAAFAATMTALAAMNGTVTFNTEDDGNGGFRVTSSSVDLSKTSTPRRSGGGGGGKSKAETLVDEQKKKKQERDHMLKMIQYRETEYQNADQLTNYGSMLEYENKWREEQIPIIESNIEALKAQLNTVTKGSDDWYTLTQAIMDNEEEIEEHNKAIDENTKKIEENEQAILKLHTDLENTVDTEIKNRIQKERDMNDGTVDMQNTILEAIKQRYQNEWDRQVHNP